MPPSPFHAVSRRQFLALGGSVALTSMIAAACGGSSSSSGGAGGSNSYVLVTRYPKTNLVPGSVRLPISLADVGGQLLTDATAQLPETLTASVVNTTTGEVLIETVTATKHAVGLPQPYWPFIVDVDEIGIYSLIVNGGPEDGASFQLLDPATVSVPLVGDPLPPFDTPTVDNAQDLDPICTFTSGTCPFHTTTLTDALSSGKPVAYLIGTPAYCKTGTCSPALETLIEAQKNYGDKIVFVHAEVYTDRTATTVAPAVRAYYMDFEPSLFITDPQGVLAHRLDAIFDADEVNSVLSSVAG